MVLGRVYSKWVPGLIVAIHLVLLATVVVVTVPISPLLAILLLPLTALALYLATERLSGVRLSIKGDGLIDSKPYGALGPVQHQSKSPLRNVETIRIPGSEFFDLILRFEDNTMYRISKIHGTGEHVEGQIMLQCRLAKEGTKPLRTE